MQSNIGLLDRYVRLVSGLLIYGAGSQMKRGSALAKGTMLSIGAMKIAEGVTGWCPIMQACGASTKDKPSQATISNVKQVDSLSEQAMKTEGQSSSAHHQANGNHGGHSSMREEGNDRQNDHQGTSRNREQSGVANAVNEAYTVGNKSREAPSTNQLATH